ncbi:hypothetical protein ACIOEZ_34505 [Streptomyces sp. NPDC087866]|uniref:hypothetical protein n=1 Tax=Streptomyces sp. NPDC087866 TaxID=3365815 RepID=UPI003815013B
MTTPADNLRDLFAAAFRGLNEGGGTLADLDEESDVNTLADAALAVARQVLGTPTTTPAPALEPQDHPGADLFVALQAAGLDDDEAHRRMYAYAAMVLRQEKATAAAPAAPADRATDRRRLTPNEHDRAWHAIEGSAGEEGADPDTILNAVLHALRIDPPTAEEEQAASPSRRLADEAQPTETDDGDPICGDRYDDETCELEPEHAGAHCAGIVCWDYGRAPAATATEEPQP